VLRARDGQGITAVYGCPRGFGEKRAYVEEFAFGPSIAQVQEHQPINKPDRERVTPMHASQVEQPIAHGRLQKQSSTVATWLVFV
jgi:hypothetical protein